MRNLAVILMVSYAFSLFAACGVDSDSDGEPDVTDQCPLDPDKTSPGECGCGIAEGSCSSDTDADDDGTPDQDDQCPLDPDKTQPGECGCGVVEGTCSNDTDSDGDGVPDPDDECPQDPNKNQVGICGCGNSDQDSDADNTADCKDNCPNDPNKTEPGECGCGMPEDACGDDTWQSSQAYYRNGGLHYETDSEGNRIPDFSYVGYNYGAALPEVSVVHTISPVNGDNTKHIQDAVDHVGSLSKNANGIRGALLLRPGTYATDDIVYVPFDGVVIRGSGRGTDPSNDTIISSTRSGSDETVFLLGNKYSDDRWTREVSGSKVSIADSKVPIGQRTLNVSSASGYKVGDMVVVQQVPKAAWFSAVDEGGTAGDTAWSDLGSDFTIRYLRFISAINGNLVKLDAPFYHRLNSNHGDLQIYKYNSSTTGSKLHYKVGIENMRIDIKTNGGTDENHTQNAVKFRGVIDGWAKGITALHFKKAGISFQRSSRMTAEDCFSGPPVSQITGSRRYNFDVSAGGQQILFKDCIATDARHGFVANGEMSSNGIVVHNGELRKNITGSEGHRHWTLGMLFDQSTLTSHANSGSRGYCAYNRGDWGTSHGWGSANSVLWNISSVSGTSNVVQKPPAAQNYAIGVDHATGAGPYSQPAGLIEGTGEGSSLYPPSLYQAQLSERGAID